MTKVMCTTACCLSAGVGLVAESIPLQQPAVPPVFNAVDVLVLGGSSRAVVAAAAAAKRGMRVALISSRPYVGEDLCETSRYVEMVDYAQSELPLLCAMCRPPEPVSGLLPTLPFTYAASMPSAATHADTKDQSVLRNRKLLGAAQGSVQYDGDVDIDITLEKETELDNVTVFAYQREDFIVKTATLSVRQDDGSYRVVSSFENSLLDEKFFDKPKALRVSAPGLRARQLRLRLQRPAGVKRLLLSEICVQTPAMAAGDEPRPEKALPPYPMQIKRALDAELLDNGVQYLYNSQLVGVLKDQAGVISGAVIANRSGLQSIAAKVLIDATENAMLVQLADVALQPLPAGDYEFTRYVLGGSGPAPAQGSVRRWPHDIQITGGHGRLEPLQPVWEYRFTLPLKELNVQAVMAVEQQCRDWSWSSNIVEYTGRLKHRVANRIFSQQANERKVVVDELDLAAFQPAALSNVLVLSHSADLCDDMQEAMLNIETSLRIGMRVGEHAATLAKGRAQAEVLATGAGLPTTTTRYRVQPLRTPHRFGEGGPAVAMDLPVLGNWDVVVVGGGTGGGPAAIGALRHGAKTLLLEYLNELGGISTAGGITRYYYGHICGFTAEMDAAIGKVPGTPDWNRIDKGEWYRKEIRKQGGDIWTSSLVFGAVLDPAGKLSGVCVATPFGPGIVLANSVIDSTGNSDIAAAAGAACQDQEMELGVQGTGLSPLKPGEHYVNTDYMFSDDSDIIDLWRTFILGRERFKHAYDLGQLIATRERRRIVGDFIVSPLDIFNQRTYPDTICVSRSNFDSHGYTVHPLFTIKGPDHDAVFADLPFRSLLPRGVDGLLVTGLGISGHRDAMPILRMQPDVQNHGYAAGVAAAMAAASKKSLRDIDLKALQRHLVDIGNLPERVLTDVDNYPLPQATLTAAIEQLDDDWRRLSVVLAEPERSLPLLRDAWRSAELPEQKLRYAHMLGMLGDNTGFDTLLAAVQAATDWDDGWNYRGMGQFGPSLSLQDSMIIALGRIGDRRAQDAILAKTKKLTTSHKFSHFRAVSLALTQVGDHRAAAVLAELLKQPDMSGHDQPITSDPRSFAEMANPDYRRTEELREIFLAAALYRCGDVDGMGKAILERYAQDGRGIYARHAKYVLANP
ncbi:FAD-dependent oxidoreductase [Oligosphaera ethanolica]|uniref:FAD-dependent oxidoreductase n=1 Tax=Oligosphaera ethanolica TaxID=760260 RepID=A0AAE4AQD8_9BACT|nr:FAD-dependent oxidoreductase [Oligosphaera ethanolica]MDQ0291430.1 hypothetical protein [Oligosphaera ethanolica]